MNLKKLNAADLEVKRVVLWQKPPEFKPLVLGWGLVCWAGSQVSVLGLKFKKLLFSHLGTIFIGLALTGLLFIWGPLLFFETRYQLSQKISSSRQKTVSHFSQLIQKDINKTLQVAPDANFSLVIPKIGAKAKVIANVDSSDEKAYTAALKQGVAHAKGTFFPGMNGNITLYAHSTDAPINIARFNAVFYLLKELEKGDLVYVYFKGAKRTYRVSGKEILAASAVEPFKKQTGGEMLILQTCWPPGTSLQRLLVYAKPA